MKIEVLKRRKQDLLERMNIELSSLKSSIDDYKKMIRSEFDDNADLIHRRDNQYGWINCHYERFLENRVEFLELKSYLLGYEDTKMDKETIDAVQAVNYEAQLSALGDGNREVAKAVNTLDKYIERTEYNA